MQAVARTATRLCQQAIPRDSTVSTPYARLKWSSTTSTNESEITLASNFAAAKCDSCSFAESPTAIFGPSAMCAIGGQLQLSGIVYRLQSYVSTQLS